jgi:riboflavin biosynthesis pyrimidine reductase
VTTGETARAESYRSSRFAPIVFLTKNRNSLTDVPAVNSPGSHSNIFLDSKSADLDFVEITSELRQRGFDSFLFEGGPTALQRLLASDLPLQLLLSVVYSELSTDESMAQVQPKAFLEKDLSRFFRMSLADDFIAGVNRTSRWVRQAS